MNKPLSHKITLQQLDVIDQNIESATGMPNPAYTDSAFFTFERDHVLGTSWTALVFCVDYEANNTVTPIEFMGLPLIIAKDDQGEISVFHNVCSHRGRILVTEQKKTNGTLICPYHSWTYDFTGKLRATPHIGGIGNHKVDGFCPQDNGLKTVRSHIWLGVLFINLSADAEAFDDYTKPLLDRYHGFVGEHGFDHIEYAGSHGGVSMSVNCNWKLAMENFCEAYHLPWIHPSLNTYSPLENHYNLVINKNFAGQRTTKFNLNLTEGESFSYFENWPKEQTGCAEYPIFYPNLFLGFQENHLFLTIIKPIDIDQTDEDLRLVYVDYESANDDKFESARIANHTAWKKVFSEDVTSVEGMQRGRYSSGYSGGTFSPVQDALTLHFHQWLARKYRSGYCHEEQSDMANSV